MIKKDKQLIITILVVGAIGAFSVLPIKAWHIVSPGLDAYRAHTPLFAQRTVSQTLQAAYPITGLAFIMVDYQHANQPTDVTVTVSDSTMIATGIIPAPDIHDDMFARVVFDKPLSAQGTVTIELQAPQATKETMVAVRFDPEHTDLSQPRTEYGVYKTGMYALQVQEKLPLWRYLVNLFHTNEQRWYYIATATGAVLLAVALAFRLGWQSIPHQYHRPMEYAVLGLLLIVAAWSRLSIIPHLGGASGGDPYNYLFITKSIVQGENPLSGEKRLPGFPLLLVPSFLNQHNDDVAAMRIISILSAAGSLWMLSLLAKNLHLPWSIQLLAPAALAWQKDFFWTSLRPEPYTFFTFLLLTALVLVLSARQPWQQILYGLVLGYAAMTRQEGFLLAVLMFVISLFLWRAYIPAETKKFFSWPTLYAYLRMYLPALLVVSPFFITNITTYGNPFFTPYFEGDRLQIVDSWAAFKDNAGAAWGVLGSSWRTNWDELERYDVFAPLFITALLILLGWNYLWLKTNILKNRWSELVVLGCGILISVVVIFAAGTTQSSFNSIVPPVVAAVTISSLIPFLVVTGWRGVAVILVLASQLLIATWFHPFAKHYQQSFPLILLVLVTGLLAPAIRHIRIASVSPEDYRLVISSLAIAVLVPLAIITAIPLTKVHVEIDNNNAAAALDSVLYRAVKAAMRYDGPYGADQPYLQARLYFEDDASYFLDETTTAAQEAAWIRENGVRTMVVTNDGGAFTHAQPTWQKAASFKAEGKGDQLYESFVYRIPQ